VRASLGRLADAGPVAASFVIWGTLASVASAACLDEGVAGLAGAVVLERHEGFALPGQARTGRTRISRACVGVFAVGEGEVLDLDVVVRSETGEELAADRREERWAYVRVCGETSLRWSVRVAEGRGPWALAILGDAPEALPPLGNALTCFAGRSGVGTRTPDVGREPPREDAAAKLRAHRAWIEARGYEPIRDEVWATRIGGLAAELRAGACYAIGAIGDDGSRIALRLLAPEGSEVTAEQGRGMASVRFCARTDGAFRIEAADDDSERFAIVLHRLDLGAPMAHVRGPSRVLLAELRALWESRGFSLEPTAWLHLQDEEEASMRLDLGPGCEVVAVLPAAELAGADVDLELAREGLLIGADRGPREVAATVTCGAGGAHRLLVSARRGEGRVLVLRGRAR